MTQQLLSSTTFGTAGGNYDGTSTTFSSEQIKASGHEGYTNGLHTIVGVVKDFVGIITIQASLATAPSTDTDWFDLSVLIGDGTTITTDGAVSNVTVSATYIRLKISSFTAGNITQVQIRY